MLLRALVLLIAMGIAHASIAQRPEVTDLVCEYLVNPVGIDATQPRFSWKIQSSARDVSQSAYEIRVGTAPDVNRGRNIVWNSGKVASSQSTHVRYGGPSLQSRQRLYWQVRIWDNSNKASAWSAPAFWEMGLLTADDWSAQWIKPLSDDPEAQERLVAFVRKSMQVRNWDNINKASAWSAPAFWEMGLLTADDWSAEWIKPLSDDPEAQERPVALVRKSFQVGKPIRSARLYVTSHGLYEAHLNGQRVGDAVLTPGWTSYNNRLQYQVYDVTDNLRAGENAAGVMLADGWYRGNIGFSNQRNQYGTDIALLYQLEITYTDGSTD